MILNFKELFDKYKAGQASPEEIEIVESEIEKNELINDYLADSIDDQLFKDKDLMADEKSNKDNKLLLEVQRAINKKLRRLALYASAIVIVLLLGLQFVVSPLVNLSYYNPSRVINNFFNQLLIDSSVFTELHYPGTITSSAHAERLGFGKYNVKINQWDSFKNSTNVYEGRVERGEMRYMQQDFYNFPVSNAFRYGVYPFQEFRPEGDKAEIEELSSMPSSARAMVYVSFKEDLSISDVTSLMKEHNTLYFTWIAVRNAPKDVQVVPQFGFEPTGTGIVIANGTVDDDKYPHFELALVQERPYSPEALETHFKSLVRYMVDTKDFLNLIYMPVEIYEKVLNYVEENGVKSYGVLVKGSPEEILRLRENPSVDSIRIDNIKISSYSK
jgi:hypothetical protein